LEEIVMTLDEQIERLRKEIKSDRLSMSIGELAGLYERGELDIHPKFQRFLRWSDDQKTKLIESILLRIPIPPIFVAQDPDGKWDVVDGVQRLGTIFQFFLRRYRSCCGAQCISAASGADDTLTRM
jgi:uncharacterized protein with ParB-like and HNH nuclease domain